MIGLNTLTGRLAGLLKTGARPDNAPRFADKPLRGHTESWFVRANDPSAPRALWLKITVLRRHDGSAVAEAWCSLFDAAAGRTWGARDTVELDPTRCFPSRVPLRAEVAGCTLSLDDDGGQLSGELRNARGQARWELTLRRVDGALGEPLCMMPTRRMIDAPLPRNKLLTPMPVLRCSGTLVWDGARVEVDDWIGMQGHNWGAAHAPEYVWGQCVFADPDDARRPVAMVEAASGRIELGGRTSPLLSMMTVRRGGRELRFDRLLDTWNQRPHIEFPGWSLRMQGADGQAVLSMRGEPDEMVCLGYENPDRTVAHCLNSKLARVTLRVNPANDDAFELTSAHGGALEFLNRGGGEPPIGPVV